MNKVNTFRGEVEMYDCSWHLPSCNIEHNIRATGEHYLPREKRNLVWVFIDQAQPHSFSRIRTVRILHY
jgi:hypothetical protein